MELVRFRGRVGAFGMHDTYLFEAIVMYYTSSSTSTSSC